MADQLDFRSWSVGELRRYLQQRGVSTAGAVERGDLVELAQEAASAASAAAAAAAAPAPPQRDGSAPGAQQPSQSEEGSLADAMLAAFRQRAASGGADAARMVAALERQLQDGGFRAAVGAHERQLRGLPADEGMVPVEIMPGVSTYMRAEQVGELQARLAEAQEEALRQVAGGGGASSSNSGGGGGSSAGSLPGGEAGAAAAAGAAGLGSAARPSAGAGGGSGSAAKRCGACGRAPEPGSKLKKCAGCRQVLYCGSDCQRQHWRGGHSRECARLHQQAA